VVLVAAAMVLAALGHPLLTGEIYTDTDLGNLHLPLRHFYSQCLASGASFNWFPHQHTGLYLHGEGQAGLYHPLNYLLYRFVPLVPAFTLELLRSYLVAFGGMYWLMRRRALPRDAAALAAFSFTFCGFNFVHFMHLNAIGITAHLPWLLGAVDVAMRDSDRRKVAWAAFAVVLLTASQILLGHPQFVWLCLVAVGFMLLFLVSECRTTAGRLPLVALALILGGLAAGVQALPTWESLTLSHRLAPPAGYVSSLALEPADLIQVVAPYLFQGRAVEEGVNELALYSGALMPVSLTWVLFRRRQLGEHRPLARAALVLAGVSVLLALGDQGGLYRLHSLMPIAGLFRAPARYILLAEFSGAVAVAIAYADLVRLWEGRSRLEGRRPWLVLSLPLASIGVALAWALGGGRTTDSVSEPGLSPDVLILAGPIFLVGSSALFLLSARRVRGALLGIAMLACLDQAAYGLIFVSRSPPTDIQTFLGRWPIPPQLGDHRLNWGPPPLSMMGIRLASGYMALTPQRQLQVGQYRLRTENPESLRAALRVAGVGWAYKRRVADPLPRARLVTHARRTQDLERDLGLVDLGSTALVSEAIELGGGVRGSAEILRDLPGDVEIRTRASSRQMLVLSESFHRGWRASSDGDLCPVVPVYGDFMGCVVQPGEHVVRFHFEPRSLVLGMRLSALGIGLAALGLVVLLRWPERITDPRSGGA